MTVLLSGVLIVALIGLPAAPRARAAGEIVQNAGHLSAAVLPNGQPALLYRSFEQGTSMHFKRYTSETALETSQFISAFQPPYPQLAVFQGVTVAAYAADDGSGLVYFSISEDGGVTWEPEFAPFAERTGSIPRVVASLDGQLLYVFDATPGQRPTYRVTASPSLATWSAPLPAGDDSMRPTVDCSSVPDPDNTFACFSAHPFSFQEIRPGVWIYVTASDSGYLRSGRGTQIGTLGGPWSAQVDHGGLPDGTPCCASDMTPSTFLDRFANVYFLRVTMDGTDLYYRKSVDAGFTWGDPVFAYDPGARGRRLWSRHRRLSSTCHHSGPSPIRGDPDHGLRSGRCGLGWAHTYEVVRPVTVRAGLVQPWFGQSGLGIRYELPSSVAELIEAGVLRRVGP